MQPSSWLLDILHKNFTKQADVAAIFMDFFIVSR